MYVQFSKICLNLVFSWLVVLIVVSLSSSSSVHGPQKTGFSVTSRSGIFRNFAFRRSGRGSFRFSRCGLRGRLLRGFRLRDGGAWSASLRPLGDLVWSTSSGGHVWSAAGHRNMGSRGLEAVLVSNVGNGNERTVWGRVLIGTSNFKCFEFFVSCVLKFSLFFCGYAVSCFVAVEIEMFINKSIS